MRKVKLTAKSEKSVGAFIADEKPDEDEVLSFAQSAQMSEIGKDKSLADEHTPLVAILKEELTLRLDESGCALVRAGLAWAVDALVEWRATFIVTRCYSAQMLLDLRLRRRD